MNVAVLCSLSSAPFPFLFSVFSSAEYDGNQKWSTVTEGEETFLQRPLVFHRCSRRVHRRKMLFFRFAAYSR